MSGICEKCKNPVDEQDVICPGCGEALNPTVSRTQKLKKAEQDKFNNILASFYLLFSATSDISVFYERKPVFFGFLPLALPLATYLLLFIHIAIDKIQLEYIKPLTAVGFAFSGLFIALATILANAAIIVFSSKILHSKLSFIKTLRALGMSYSIPLLIAFMGLVFKILLNWSSVVFGVCAILVAIIPIQGFTLKVFKDKPQWSYAITTLCGIVQILLCNAFLFRKFFYF